MASSTRLIISTVWSKDTVIPVERGVEVQTAKNAFDRRLVEACRTQKKTMDLLRPVIRAYEIDGEVATNVRRQCATSRRAYGGTAVALPAAILVLNPLGGVPEHALIGPVAERDRPSRARRGSCSVLPSAVKDRIEKRDFRVWHLAHLLSSTDDVRSSGQSDIPPTGRHFRF
jgi:hypothetical protein